jgi:hypothetical protein
MKKNFILTDVMKTGYHLDIEDYIKYHTLDNQEINFNSNYYNLHLYDLSKYNRKIAMVDSRTVNSEICKNYEFQEEYKRRLEKLREKNFVLLQVNPWESTENHATYESSFTPFSPNLENVSHLKWFEGWSWWWFYMHRRYEKYQFIIDHSKKKYDFLLLLKQKKKHREFLYKELKKNNILSNSLYSCFFDNKRLPPEYELPFLEDRKKYPLYGMDQYVYEKPYNESGISIVSETQVKNDMFITEKTWKPIMTKQIFIILGPDNILKKLKNLGFKTFSSIFDESYDENNDLNKKILSIVNLCNTLKNSDWSKLYSETEEIREHNYNHFFDKKNISQQVNKEILRWFEFSDRR